MSGKRRYGAGMPFTERRLSIEPPVEIAGRQVKQYHVTITPQPIEPEIVTAAGRGRPDRRWAGLARQPAAHPRLLAC